MVILTPLILFHTYNLLSLVFLFPCGQSFKSEAVEIWYTKDVTVFPLLSVADLSSTSSSNEKMYNSIYDFRALRISIKEFSFSYSHPTLSICASTFVRKQCSISTILIFSSHPLSLVEKKALHVKWRWITWTMCHALTLYHLW